MTPKRTILLDFEDTVECLGLNRADIISPRCDGNETEILLISNSFPLTIPCKTMTTQRLLPDTCLFLCLEIDSCELSRETSCMEK